MGCYGDGAEDGGRRRVGLRIDFPHGSRADRSARKTLCLKTKRTRGLAVRACDVGRPAGDGGRYEVMGDTGVMCVRSICRFSSVASRYFVQMMADLRWEISAGRAVWQFVPVMGDLSALHASVTRRSVR